MRKVFIAATISLLAFIILAEQGCKRLDRLVSFNLAVENQFVIPVFPDTVLTDEFIGNETFSYLLSDLRFQNETEFAKNKTFPTQVESCEIQSITLSIDSGSVATFNRMKKIELYIGSGITQEQLIGVSENIQQNQASVNIILNITNEQFKTAIRSDLYRLRLLIEWQAPIDGPVYIKNSMNFRLKAIPTED
jgi:hypothetical protein